MSLTCRAVASLAAALLTVLIVTPFAAADDVLGTTEEFQSVASGRVLVGEAPCGGCGVSAYEPALDLAYAAVTDGTGAFQVVGLVPGQYIFVADGPNRQFSLSLDSIGTQVIGPFTVAGGYNLTGLLLQAPQWVESRRSEHAFEFGCGPPQPPVVFNGQVLARFIREGDEVVADDHEQIECGDVPDAIGCTQPKHPPIVADVQCLGTEIHIMKPWVLETKIRIHRREWNCPNACKFRLFVFPSG